MFRNQRRRGSVKVADPLLYFTPRFTAVVPQFFTKHGSFALPRILALLLCLLALGWPTLVGAQTAPATEGRFFPQTGYTMAPEFSQYYDAHGGLVLFGYPITAPHLENGLLTQYFERERLEYHPENKGTAYEVLLGLLGSELVAGRPDAAFQPLSADQFTPAGSTLIAQTGHTIGGPFAKYWQANGGLAIFGYPISEEFVQDGVRQQWFERARFELHPELPPAFLVSLGLLGREALDATPAVPVEISVGAGPTQQRHLKVDIAQGGESQDPAFLHNVIPQLQALKPALIRIDNIYTHFNAVQRGPDGLSYDWSRLDSLVDDIMATGAKPFFNLSYMPPTLSGADDNVQPPQSLAEWRDVVAATTQHYNIDRKLGIRYWEVWNEPNESAEWTGNFIDYMNFYDATRRGVRGVDPGAVVGGPALSQFDPILLDWLASFQPYADDGGYLGFLSWHAFGVPPEQLIDQVHTAKNLIAQRPGWNPEIIVDEINVKTGGAGDTSAGLLSDTSAAAAHILASLNALENAGADRALVFEAKDGEKQGQEFWGRWGLLTYNGLRKPSYHALAAYQSLGTDLLPTQVSGCAECGMLASPDGDGAKLILWNDGSDNVNAHITLPPSLAALTYNLSILDSRHNNPSKGDSDELVTSGKRTGSSLNFAMEPESVIILEGAQGAGR